MEVRGALALVAACLLAAAPVRADDKDSAKVAASRAAALFEEGRALGKAGQWAEACDRFADSFELVPAVGTQLNFADCLEREGKLRRAWQLFDEAAAESERSGPELRSKFARDRADALQQQLGLVVVKLAEPDAAGLQVAIDGRKIKPAARIRELVEPGAVTVVVKAPDRTTFQRTVRVKRGDKTTVEVPLLAGGTGRERRRGWVYTAGVFALAGTGLLGYGVVASVESIGHYNSVSRTCASITSCPEYNEAGEASGRAALAGLSGLSLVVVGAVIYAVAPKHPASRVTVSPTASARGAGIGVFGRF